MSAANPTTVTLTASPSGSNQFNNTTIVYTATADQDVGPTIYYITIWEGTTKLISCSTGTVCHPIVPYSTSGANTTRTFTAKITKSDDTVFLTGNSIITQWYTINSISLAASPSGNQLNTTSVTYTATTDNDVNATPYVIRIYEGATQQKSCSTGTTCAYTTSDSNTTRTFVGKVVKPLDESVLLTSSSVSTTWSPPPVISVTPASKDYGSVNVGSDSATQTFTVKNTGGGTLSGSVTFAGLPFVCVNDCSTSYSLGANSSRTYDVLFRPTAVGAASGTMSFTGGGGQSVSLSGTGIAVDTTAPTLAQVTAVPSPTNDTTPNYTFSSTEAGAITYGGACSSATTQASSGNNTVTFNTLAAGSYTNCTVKVTDAAGNSSTALAVNSFTIDPTPTFPSNTWERLWHVTSGSSPNVTLPDSNFLGETPNESVEKFSTDWIGGILAYGRSDSIGFKSSRTINFPAAGTYRFTIGSDDGVRLFLDEAPTSFCDQWGDGGYRTTDCDVSISAGNHKFQLDYYENTGNAKVSFSYVLSPCAMSDTIPKSGDDIPASVTVPVVTATGTKQSPLMISHYGADSDGSGVIYKFLTHNEAFPGNARVQMDDKPLGVGDCDNDLTWDTSWGDPPETEYNFSTLAQWQSIAYSGAHTLSYGFQIFTDTPSGRTSVIKDTAVLECFSSGPSCSPTFLDDRSFNILKPIESDGVTGVSSFGWKFNLVECTSNAHCTVGNVNANSDADPNKQICNLPITNNSPNFPQNTCIDSVPPTSKITSVVPTLGGILGVRPQQPDEPSGTKSIFFNAPNLGNTAKYYTIAVQDTDNIDTAPQLSCYYQIQEVKEATGVTIWLSPEFTRTCSSTFSFPVGTIGAGGYCAEQGNDTCRLRVWAVDRAVNSSKILPVRNVYDTYKDETRYADPTLAPSGFDTFWFGVDWTPPSAQ